jgi:hypothetical protein
LTAEKGALNEEVLKDLCEARREILHVQVLLFLKQTVLG